MAVKKKKIGHGVGKRKKSIARATAKEGSGKVKINGVPLDLFDKYRRLRIQESLILAEDAAKKVDIIVTVKGGGPWGQADASRTAISNAILDWTGDRSLRQAYINYDRSLVVSDPRRTEPHKPSRSSKGPRRSKQQSKR